MTKNKNGDERVMKGRKERDETETRERHERDKRDEKETRKRPNRETRERDQIERPFVKEKLQEGLKSIQMAFT